MGVGKDQGHMVVVTLGFIAAYTVVFEKRIGSKDYDEFEFGGCGCFLDSDEAMA